jgi:purine-binding chemotaxis protein CheW
MKNENIREISEVQDMQNIIPWLIFRLNEKIYTANSRYITSIVIKPDEVTRVPNVPKYIEGLIHLRGNVIPLINLKLLLKIGDNTENNTDEVKVNNEMVVVFEKENSFMGLVVDKVLSVENISKYEETEELKRLNGNGFVTGVAKGYKTDDILLVIDEEKIMQDA